MTDSTEVPLPFPDADLPRESAARKPRKAAARKPRTAKTAPSEEVSAEPAVKKNARATAKTPRVARKKTVKKAEESAELPLAESPVEPAQPAAAVKSQPVLPEPPAVARPVEAPAPQPPAEPAPPAGSAGPEPQPAAAADPAPEARAERREPARERRGRQTREGRDNRRGNGRRGDRRRPHPQAQPPVPQPPSMAGAVAEEWSPRARTAEPAPSLPQAGPESSPAAAQPAAPLKTDELTLPRREMTREERIAAAKAQVASAEPPPAASASEPPAPEQPRPEPVYGEGIVEVSGKGFGFLRDPKRNFAQHPSDIFVTPEVCRRYALRDGMWIRGEIRRGNRGPQLFRLTEIEGEDPEQYRNLPRFDELTTLNPNRFVKLETVPERTTTRVIDLMAPIGRGQRGLIVAPPRTGKTTLLEHIADAVTKNHPDLKLIILLVDERPEEVTEIRRAMPSAELMASSNDQEIKSHTRICQLAIERARRLVEMGKHVFILLDSITRVGRAFNNATGGGGRTMSGGVDARALEIPRKLFASARNTEEAGSLTIIATALIETGSRMDDLIFQEFKGTGNMELVLDRKISDLRIYPAVDIFLSGTRREELILPEADLHKINTIRRGLSGHKPAEAIERLLFFLHKFPTNAQMLREIPG